MQQFVTKENKERKDKGKRKEKWKGEGKGEEKGATQNTSCKAVVAACSKNDYLYVCGITTPQQ